jgi:hypothetical protein
MGSGPRSGAQVFSLESATRITVPSIVRVEADVKSDEDRDRRKLAASEFWTGLGDRLRSLLSPEEYSVLIGDLGDLADAEEAMQRHGLQLAILMAKIKHRRAPRT